MNLVSVQTPGGSYPIHVAPGRLSALAQSIPADATTIALVTNTTVDGLLGDRVQTTLETTGKRVIRIVLFVGVSHHMNHDASPLWDENGGTSAADIAAA